MSNLAFELISGTTTYPTHIPKFFRVAIQFIKLFPHFIEKVSHYFCKGVVIYVLT
jgi:hypothetical protein